MTNAEHPWVAVAWDVIEPSDVVLAPDGSRWWVTAKIDMPGDRYLSFLLEPIGVVGERVWTDRERGSSLEAWRFQDVQPEAGAESFAAGRLRLGGFDVDPL